MSLSNHCDLRARTARRSKRSVVWALLGISSLGCVLDTDDRCGPNQVSWEGNERCVCAPGTGYTPDGCVPCAEHETSSSAGCICEAGYARSAVTDPCTAIPEGIGTVCTSDAECLNPSYPACHESEAGDSYCTSQSCAGAADCTGGYACNTLSNPTYCQRPPTGVGQSCAAPGDCAGKEADFCELFVSRTCLVQGCTVEPDSCFPGSECCDFTSIGLPPLCIPAGQCAQ